MIATGILLNQLTTLQQLKVESTLQAQVSFDSPVLLVFNSMMMGENKNETVANCNISGRSYDKAAFPIRTIIHQVLGIEAKTKKDQFIAEVNAAIYNNAEENDSKKLKQLEELFHQMKRFNLEHESAQLLDEMANLSSMSPLFAVYKHLNTKYAEIEELNNKLYVQFESLCVKTSHFIDGNPKGTEIKELITAFKGIRLLASKNENRVSKAVLNSSTLLLATYCGQIQLLRPNNWTLAELFKICENSISEMHFGAERTYLDSIYSECLEYAIDHLKFKLSKGFYTKMKDISNPNTYNFGFELENEIDAPESIFKENVIDNFVFNIIRNPFIQGSKVIYP